jgi:RNA polymerase sigma-32 factor
LKDKLPEFQKKLNDRELRILSDRLLAEEPKTLQEVADLYGLTRERARQIEAKVVAKLKDFLQL